MRVSGLIYRQGQPQTLDQMVSLSGLSPLCEARALAHMCMQFGNFLEFHLVCDYLGNPSGSATIHYSKKEEAETGALCL